MYTIIEDASPYYIRFTFPGLKNVIEYVKSLNRNCYTVHRSTGYFHSDMKEEYALETLKLLPLTDKFVFFEERISVFSTWPRGACGVHKDGPNRKVSFNIPIEILDSECITKWFSDETFAGMEVQGLPYSRNVTTDFKVIDTLPYLKAMTAKPDEMVLFNTDIYHSFDNRNSNNWRKILTLRLKDVEISFDESKKILFGD